ncbi:hypothetical protein [Amycolatopsis jejuensis]|uniref:hypothetical protein n=1 Tax=Amycolatopsis jejuensis TaxID=330084 RepID=UPI00052526F0|nr:hypothetical protein [Amycolatopsis jejuensis]
MTAPHDDSTALALIRQELDTYRRTMHDELGALRKEMTDGWAEMRAHVSTVAPQMAVIHHRLDEHDREIAEGKAQRERDVAENKALRDNDVQGRRWNIGTWIAVVSIIIAIAAVTVAALK